MTRQRLAQTVTIRTTLQCGIYILKKGRDKRQKTLAKAIEHYKTCMQKMAIQANLRVHNIYMCYAIEVKPKFHFQLTRTTRGSLDKRRKVNVQISKIKGIIIVRLPNGIAVFNWMSR